MTTTCGLGRRAFTRNLAMASAPLILPSAAIGRGAVPSPSNRIAMGFIGIGTKEEKRHALLVSDKRYKDFRLRVEFMSVLGNSGLYFRVEKVDHAVGVKGFQAEICPPGFPAGGLFETLGRGWVARSDQELVNSLFKQYDWNTMEVVAVGGDIQVLLNGTKVCAVTDDPGLPEGHVGLQMHGNGDMDIRFRRVEIMQISP